jgi:plasmid replication initiation protein
MYSTLVCSTVVHANALLNASYSLTTTETRLIALASTKVDSRKTNIGEICITVAEFELAYGIASNNSYTELKNAVRSIMRKPIRLNDGDDFVELAWFIKNQYKTGDDGSHVMFQFSPLIEPYLFELKERFTSINFEFASKLNTPFSFRLYQWLKKIENIENNKKNHVRNIILDIAWMKDKAQLTGYERWDNFNLRLIKPAVDKINANTDISVFYEPIKLGRKVTAVKFSYVLEKDNSCIKPIRPRLYRRPKVIKGSHEEGVWMRKNLALLLEYEVQLKRYDDRAKLPLSDLRKIAEYASICDRITEKRVKKEIDVRVNHA